MNISTRRNYLITAAGLVVIIAAAIAIVWFLGYLIADAIAPTPVLTQGDSCSGAAPLSPCLSAVPSPLEDNLGLWSIFAIGIGAGFLLAACAWLPLYRKGKREGHEECTVGLVGDLVAQRPRDARYDWVPGHPEHMR